MNSNCESQFGVGCVSHCQLYRRQVVDINSSGSPSRVSDARWPRRRRLHVRRHSSCYLGTFRYSHQRLPLLGIAVLAVCGCYELLASGTAPPLTSGRNAFMDTKASSQDGDILPSSYGNSELQPGNNPRLLRHIPATNPFTTLLSSVWSSYSSVRRLQNSTLPRPPPSDDLKGCDGSSVETCRLDFARQIEKRCGAETDLTSTKFGFHPTIAAGSFISGFAWIGGDPNGVESLLQAKTLSGNVLVDWIVEYLATMWFYFFWVGLLVICGLVLLSWSPALCSRGCRRCLGGCFCNKCCNERQRTRPIERVSEARFKKIKCWFILCPFLWTLVFCIVSLIYAIYIGWGFQRTGCQGWRLSYGLLFGDGGISEPEQLRFPGLLGLQPKFVDYSKELELVDDTVGETNELLKLVTKPGCHAAVAEITPFSQHLAATKKRLASTSIIYGSWNPSGSKQVETTLHQDCFNCDFVDDNNIAVSDIDQMKQVFWAIADAAYSNVATFQSSALEPILKALPTVMEDTGLHFLAWDIVDLVGEVSEFDDGFSYVSIAVWIFYLIVPVIALVIWIFSLVTFERLRRKYRRKEDAKGRRSRSWFACLCFFFGCYAFVLALMGVIGLVIAQPAAEACHVLDYNLLTENMYFDYELFTYQAGGEFPTLTKNCMTHDASGRLLQAVETDIPSLSGLEDVGGKVASMADGTENSVNVAIAAMQNSHFAALNPQIIPNAHLILTSVGDQYNDDSHLEFDRRFYAMFKESLYGGLQDDDVPLSEQTDEMKQQIAAIELVAVDSIKQSEFKAEESSLKMPSARFLKEIENPDSIFGLPSQAKRLNQALSEYFDCKTHSICLGQNCSCSTSSCVRLDGELNVVVHPVARVDRDKLYITETSVDTSNEGTLGNALKCIVADLSSEEEKIVRAAQFINSLFMVALRVRSTRETNVFAMYRDGEDYSKPTASNVTYADFVDLQVENWDRYYNLKNVTLSFAPFTYGLEISANYTDMTYATVERQLDCRILADNISGGTAWACETGVADYAFTGLWWIATSVGLFAGMIMSWRLFHYFADRRNEDKDDKNNVEKLQRRSLLLQRCREGNEHEVERCCRFQEPEFAMDEEGNGCLHIAAYYNHPRVCRMLIENGCDPSGKNKFGYTPVDVAAAEGHPRSVIALVSGGANLRKTDPFGDTPIHTAARHGDAKLLATLLRGEEGSRERGPPTNLEGQTPQAQATSRGQEKITQLLNDFYSKNRNAKSIYKNLSKITSDESSEESEKSQKSQKSQKRGAGSSSSSSSSSRASSTSRSSS